MLLNSPTATPAKRNLKTAPKSKKSSSSESSSSSYSSGSSRARKSSATSARSPTPVTLTKKLVDNKEYEQLDGELEEAEEEEEEESEEERPTKRRKGAKARGLACLAWLSHPPATRRHLPPARHAPLHEPRHDEHRRSSCPLPRPRLQPCYNVLHGHRIKLCQQTTSSSPSVQRARKQVQVRHEALDVKLQVSAVRKAIKVELRTSPAYHRRPPAALRLAGGIELVPSTGPSVLRPAPAPTPAISTTHSNHKMCRMVPAPLPNSQPNPSSFNKSSFTFVAYVPPQYK
ncbi:hypothetical protein B0H14DRAFT_2572409 [Mycena olivaceomarginata]|nr:hypothetical protein B0H14DRAFT_2572409 [Mycena olivaceomarginata]